jgi:hypothetical protein
MDHSVALITATVLKQISKIKIPYFIALFILAMMNTYVPQTAMVAPYLVAMAKTGLTLLVFNWSGIKSYRVKSVG